MYRSLSRVRALGAALAFGVLMTATSAAAQAQSQPAGVSASPSPSSTPAAGGGNPAVTNSTGGPPAVPAGPATHQQAVGHLPIFDITPIFTQPDFYSSAKTQIHAYDPLDIGGTIRIPVTRKFSLQFDRVVGGTLNQPLQQQGATLPGVSRDIVLQYHGTYAFNRYFTLDVGDSFRHRIYNNDASGVSNVPFPYTVASTEHHFGYAGLAYTTKPLHGLLNSQFIFGETLDVQNVDHHVGVLCTAALVTDGADSCAAVGSVGYIDENPTRNRYYESTQSVTWVVPVDARHGTTFSYQERWGYLNFYENQPYPFNYTSAVTALLNKKFSSGFSLGMRYQYNVEDRVGAPFPQGVIHVGSYDVIATFHVDPNTWVH